MTSLPVIGHGARLLLQATAVAFTVSEVSVRIRCRRHADGSPLDRGSLVAVVLGIGAGVLTAAWCAVTVPGAAIPGRWRPLAGVVGLWLVGLLAVWIPARRAAAISPAIATRTV